jgi:hypothetical protein
LGVSPRDSEILLIDLLVNNFSLGSFGHRQFVFSFGSKGYIRFSGQDLLELTGSNQLTLLLSTEWEKSIPKQASTPLLLSPNLTPQ